MASLRIKDVETAYGALALCAGFLAAPSVGGAVKTAFKINDVRKTLTRSEKTTLKTFTNKMIASAEVALEGYKADLSPDAPLLYAQMLEQSAPKAAEIAEHALNAEALALHMFNQLEEAEHKSMRDLFLLLTTAALKPLVDEPEFVDQLKPAIYAQLLSSGQETQRGVEELLRNQGSIEEAVAAAEDAADYDFRDIARALRLPDADTAPRRKLLSDILQKARELDDAQRSLQRIHDADKVVQSYLDHAQAALHRLDLSTALALLGEARKSRDSTLKKGLQDRAEIAETEAMVRLLNSEPLEAFRLFDDTANSIATFDHEDAALRRSNYGLALMVYGERYGVDGFKYGVLIMDPPLAETAKELPDELKARLLLHRGTVNAKLYAAVGHLDGQEAFAAAEADLIAAQVIAADKLSDLHTAATARATAGWLNLQAAQFTYDAEADPFLDQAEELLTIARQLYEAVNAPYELALVKLDLADLLDRQSVRENEEGRIAKFGEAITLVRECEAYLAEGNHPEQLARTYHLIAKLLWGEAVYRLGSGGDELLESAMAFAKAAEDFRPIKADPLGWAETTFLIGEIRADQVVHTQEQDRIAGFGEARQIIDSAVTIYEEMGTEEQIEKARHSRDRIDWQIEDESAAH
ncbi:hypothetical protein [Aliiroseovarius sp. YM-037]|uniref:hypothetical protein n=1 Tax=Aliiroseovarius sp. YM-037 TaxID=3341728 RepID=UPI003A7FFEA4